MAKCDCLAAYDASLPHFVACEKAEPNVASSPLRELAEMAAYRDIDAALMAYRACNN